MNHPSDIDSQINQYLSATPPVIHGDGMLDQMIDLMHALGDPQDKLRIIHVAGTSGKTSTCYYLASLLRAAGHSVGLTTSPHVDTVRERAIVNLETLSPADWDKYLRKFFALVQASDCPASYFEFYMAFAYWLFVELGIDYAVIETGLGGTWDGSNVVTRQDKVCVITDIGLDHTEILGDTLPVIASEKSGIIHTGNTVFMNSQSPEITEVIQRRCHAQKAHLHILDQAPTDDFLARNFYLAERAVSFVLDRHLPSSQITAARQITIPARAEKFALDGKTLIMDGSHNPQKLSAFATYLDKHYPARERALIATLGANKISTLDESMCILRQISPSIILTSFTDNSSETNFRTSIDAPTLIAAAQAAGFTSIAYEPDAPHALKVAQLLPPEQIVITGSFYLLNHIRPQLLPQQKP